MRRRRRSHSRRRRRHRTAPSTSVVGYTRFIKLAGSVAASNATSLITADVADVTTPSEETVNRKLISVSGHGFFSAKLAANRLAAAQFCLWAHPEHEEWPSVDKYDPFNDGPGKAGFEGLLAPRTFCRRTMVLATPESGESQTISEDHMIRTKAARILRPGWKLSAGLYVQGDNVDIDVAHVSLLRYVVAG